MQSCRAHSWSCTKLYGDKLQSSGTDVSLLCPQAEWWHWCGVISRGYCYLGVDMLYKDSPSEVPLVCALLCFSISQQSIRKDPHVLGKKKGATVVTSPLLFEDVLWKRKRKSKTPLTDLSYFQNSWIILLNLQESDKDTHKYLSYFPSETYHLRVFERCFETIGDKYLSCTDHEDLILHNSNVVYMCPNVFISISHWRFGVIRTWVESFY